MNLISYMKQDINFYIKYFLLFLVLIIGLIFKPVLSLLIVGLWFVGYNIIQVENKLNPSAIIGLVCIVFAFNIIPSPFNPTGGELGVEYLRTSFKTDFSQLYYETFSQVYPYALIKVFQEALPVLTSTALHERSVLPSTFIRIILGVISCALIYLIQRRLTRSSSSSIAISLATALLYSGHYYVWFYLHGDQFRNAFANMYILGLVFFVLNFRSNRLLSSVFILLMAFAVIHSHRAYVFVILGLLYASVLYFVFNKTLAFVHGKFSEKYEGEYISAILYVALAIFINVVCVGVGLFILKNYTHWGSEVVFSGTSMDISGVNNLGYLQRLLLPAEIIQMLTVSFIALTWILVYGKSLRKQREQSILLIFYMFGFVLSHSWLFSYNIDLSRLFIIFFPFSVLLMVNQLFRLADNNSYISRYSRHFLVVSVVTIVLVFLVKLLWETSWNNEVQIPLLQPLMFYNINEFLRYIFSEIGILNNEGRVFTFASILFFIFLIYIVSIKKLNVNIKPIFFSVLFISMLPGIVVSCKSIIGDRLQIMLLISDAERGDVEAQYNIGLLLDRISYKTDETAKEWYIKSATNGHVLSKFKIGRWLSSKDINSYKVGIKNDKKALYWFQSAYDNGLRIPELAYSLARHYEYGLGTTVNQELALKYYILAANAKHRDALHKMGKVYESGQLGVKKDISITIGYYKQAVNSGFKALEINVNHLTKEYKRQQAVNKKIIALKNITYKSAEIFYKIGMLIDEKFRSTDEASKEYYMRAAVQGHAAAQHRMGLWLASSEKNTYKIGKKNNKQAFGWLTKSAEKNYMLAYLPLARLYENGLGTEMDYKLAFKNYKISADLGVRGSQLRLAYIYDKGELGVKPDRVMAENYFCLAKLGGYEISANKCSDKQFEKVSKE